MGPAPEVLLVGAILAPRQRMDTAVVRVMAHPATMIASDGQVVPFGFGVPHPRSYGTFARVLGVYVREKGVLSLEEAVRKMTSLPASRLALMDRGLLRSGMKADIAVFLRDRASTTPSARLPR